jgi:uncharacterized membrane protein
MALGDLYSNIHLLLRWAHVVAGIFWIGHLYFFNFVNAPFQGAIDAPTKKVVNPQLIARALWWFRWGAMANFLLGLTLFTQLYMYRPGIGFGPSDLFRGADGVVTGRAMWIMLGMTLGTIMWINVWFVIWPLQKKILPALRDGLAVDPALSKRVTIVAKANAYLSGPMLFCMLAPSHYGGFNAVTAIVAFALGLLAIGAAFGHVKVAGRSIVSKS